MSQSEVKNDLVDGLHYIIVRGQVLYLSNYVTQLEQQLKEANEVIGFYANTESHNAPIEFQTRRFRGMNDPEVGHFVSHEDYDCIECSFIFGKRARAYQQKWNK